MIVKCIQIFNEHTQQFITGNSTGMLSIGNYYNVLEIDFSNDRVYYRLLDDGMGIYGYPILVRSDDFKVISGNVPANWELKRFRESSALLGPEKWINYKYWEEDFWEDWCNGREEAIRCFNEELKIIQDTDEDYKYLIESAKIAPESR